MQAEDAFAELEPLRSGDHHAPGAEKDVLHLAEPREVAMLQGTRLQDPPSSKLIGAVALVSMGVTLFCLVSLVVTRRPAEGGPSPADGPLAFKESSSPEDGVAYDFVGEGNCKPNRPQWARKAPYEKCRATCSEATRCIGFDWDARWAFCRVRFATNKAALASPPLGYRSIPGTEGGRIARQTRESGFEGIEGSHTAGCFQKATSVPFYRLLSQPSFDGRGNALVGPLPNILEYYLETGLVGLFNASNEHLQVIKRGLLAFNGTGGGMLLPSLDATPLLRALDKERLPSVTIIVGVNSDSYNRGLGIVIEASPQINETKEHLDSYTYNGYGVHSNRNAIKFHPEMRGGQLRIEGPGGFPNTAIGFTLPNWKKSGHKLNHLEVTVRVDGSNEMLIRSAKGKMEWRVTWRHKLFDGKDIPTVYAIIDLGGLPGKPLMVGPVRLRFDSVAV